MDSSEDNKTKKKLQHQTKTQSEPNEGPLEPTVLIPIKEDRNSCYDNICSNIDRGMPGHPLENDIQQQEAHEQAEKEDDTNYYRSIHQSQKHFSSDPSNCPLEPQYLIPIKSDRNRCYDDINTIIDRGIPGHPLELDIQHQETLENTEKQDDDSFYRSHHYPESSIWNHNEENFASDVLRFEFGTRPEEGEVMQLEEPDDDFSFSSDSSVEIVRPPKSPNTSPRKKKQFISSYDPKIFYPTSPKRNSRQKVFHNIVKDHVKLRVSLKEIGLDGLDEMIPVKTVENLQRERLNRQKMRSFSKSMKASVFKPTNQTNFSKSMPKSQFNADLNKKEKSFDYSSDDSYSEHQFELSDIDENKISPPPSRIDENKMSPPSSRIDENKISPPPSRIDENKMSPPPSQNEIKIDEKIDDKQFALNVKKNKKAKIEKPESKKEAPRSPRRKNEIKSTFDRSILLSPLSSSSSNSEPA